MTWRGQWNNETIFNEQDMVHYKDGAWVCVGVSPTAVRPGTDESIWTLAAQGGSGALEYWDENAILSEVAMPNGMYQHIVTFKPSISKFNLAFPDLVAPVQGLDAVIAPYGIGNLSLTNLFTSPGMALNLSLMPNNFVNGPGSVIIGNTGSAIDLPNLTLVDVTSAERLYRIAAWASVIAGGAGTKVESPSSGTFMARRYYLPREEGGDGANLARNVVIGGENSSFRARDSLFMNTTNVSGIDDTIIRTTTIGVDGAEVAAVDSFIANALGSKMNYLVGANIVGTASSDLNGCRGANIFGSKRVNASAQHNFTVIGGNSTHVRDNADKPFYERSSVYENGLSSGQLRRFHIKSMPGQSFEEPNYEFEQTRIGPWIEDRSMYITHYDFDATFAVDGMIDGESTILEIINSSIRAYNLKFSVVYITDPGGQTGKTVVKGLKIIDKLSGENVDDVTSVAAVESREYQGNVFTNVLFNKLHFADGVAGTPRPWTMNLTGQMTELLNFSVPEGILLNDPVPVIPNNPGWEQEVS